MKSFFKILYIVLGIVCLSNTQAYANHYYGATLSVYNVELKGNTLTFSAKSVVAVDNVYATLPPGSTAVAISIGSGGPVIGRTLSMTRKSDTVTLCNNFKYLRVQDEINAEIILDPIVVGANTLRFNLIENNITRPLAYGNSGINIINNNFYDNYLPIYIDAPISQLGSLKDIPFADPFFYSFTHCNSLMPVVLNNLGVLGFRKAQGDQKVFIGGYRDLFYNTPCSFDQPLGGPPLGPPSTNVTIAGTNLNLNIGNPALGIGNYAIAMRYTLNDIEYNFQSTLAIHNVRPSVSFFRERNFSTGTYTPNAQNLSRGSFAINTGDNLEFVFDAANGMSEIRLRGIIRDAQGGTIPVTLTPNSITGGANSVKTIKASLPSLPVGTYVLEITAESFCAGLQNCNSVSSVQYTIHVTECNCLPTFKPVPNKKYVVSAWLKWEDLGAPSARCSFEDGKGGVIGILIDGVRYPDQFRPTGEIVEGWQRIMGEFTIPAPYSSFELELVGSSNANYNALFDDLRIHPFDGSFKSYVYDDVTGKLTEELDENNYFTKYEYDQSGALERVKKETQRGVMMVQESRFGNQKKTQ